MRVVKTDDVESLLAALPPDANQLGRRNGVAGPRRVVAAIDGVDDDANLASIVVNVAEEYAAALVRIGFLAVLAQTLEIGLLYFQCGLERRAVDHRRVPRHLKPARPTIAWIDHCNDCGR